MTSPANGAVYAGGTSIPFSVTASDPGGTITWVGFYVDSVLRSSTTQSWSPYTTSLSNLTTGVHTLTAVAWDNSGEWTVSAPVTVSVSAPTGVNQRPLVSVTSPASGSTYSAGATIPFTVAASDSGGTITWVGFYVDSVLRWSTTQSSGPYTTSLSNLAAGVHTLTATAWDNSGNWTASAPVSVTVSSSTGGNQPPSVSVNSPAPGAFYPTGATIPFSVSASDPDGTVTWVGFYVNHLLHSYTTQSSSPYSVSLSTLPAGVHMLTAVVWDNSGAWAASADRAVTVGASGGLSPNQPPIVSLTTPQAGATYTAPASITVSASASDGDGTIARVDFYAGSTLLGSDTTSPYSLSWNSVGAGVYSLTAMARDNAGAVTVSATRDITVTSTGLPRTAAFTPSSNHATAVSRYVLEVFTAGANTTVANPVSTQDLGKPAIVNGEIRADISATILALSPGNYVATVTAIGSAGSAQSAPSPQFVR